MYLRASKQRRADGSVVIYLQLAENVWDAGKGRSQASIVYTCGRANDAEVVERLRRLAKSILRRCPPEELVGGDGRLICAWPYGDLSVPETIWKQLGIDAIVRQQAGTRHLRVDVERALFPLVANRACAPASKRVCHEQWLKEDAHIGGTQGLKLHQFYRAMDFLEANKEAIEQTIFHRMADLLNLDVEVIFSSTTALHFEIDGEDGGDKDGNVQGSQRSGKKSCAAPRKRGHSKNGRGDAPQIVVGMEEAWRTMKSGLKMRPVFHWAPHRIHAHIAITVLSLLIERPIEHAWQDTWRNIRDDPKRVQLAQLSSPNGRVWQVTEPSPDAANRLMELRINPPKPILNLD